MTVTLEIEARTVGRSSLSIPRIALGCGNFGGIGSAPAFFGQGLNDEQAFAVMDAAWALGIRHFDTADAYGGGRSERAIGRWIRARGVRPTITTKTYNPMLEGADHGLAPGRIERQLDSSLERLGVDRIELYLAHEYDHEVALEESVGAFEEHRRAGRISEWGVSNFDREQLAAALEVGHPVAIQNAHSLFERDDGGVLPLCDRAGVAYLAFSPLAGGWLTGKYRRGRPYPAGSRMTQRPEPYRELEREETFDALGRLEAFASERRTSLAGVALAWILADPRVAQVVVGPGRPEHLDPVREALAAPLSAGDRARLTDMAAP